MVDRLLAAGVIPQEAQAAAEGRFSGMSIVVTGTLPSLSRKEAEDLIRACGGTAASSVSKKTAFVVAGEAAGSKLIKAQSLGIEVIDEAELLRRAGQTSVSVREQEESDSAEAGETIPEASLQPASDEEKPTDHLPSLDFVHRTWIEIDLDLVKENYRTACSLAKSPVTCVVKSNAYGHGAVRISQALQEAGCSSFAVSCAREAFELRANGITGEILVMGLTDRPDIGRCVREHIVMTAADLDDLRAINDLAASLGEKAQVHLKLDTGFHRLGFECSPESAQQIAAAASGMNSVEIKGLYSHLGLVNR